MMRNRLTILAAFSLAVGVANAQSANSKYTYDPSGKITSAGKFLPGPSQWPGQCNNNSVEQSPIAVTTGSPTESYSTASYTFNGGNCKYSDLEYGVVDNGVKIYYDSALCTPPSFTMPNDPDLININLGLGLGGINPTVTLGESVFGPEAGKTYNALQFHIHSKSEHTINGISYDAELHIVHAQAGLTGVTEVDDIVAGVDGSRGAAVIGFMISGKDGFPPNPMFESLLEGWETAGCGVPRAVLDGTVVSSDTFNPYTSFLDPSSCIMNYDGSLTTPDCDEIVEWNLATLPINISTMQLARLLALINDCPQSISHNGSTSRPVQGLFGRTVNEICPASRRNLRSS